jgi:hypothetical protein
MKRDKAYLKKVVLKDMEEDDYYQKTDKKSKSFKVKNNQPKQSKIKKGWSREDSEWD